MVSRVVLMADSPCGTAVGTPVTIGAGPDDTVLAPSGYRYRRGLSGRLQDTVAIALAHLAKERDKELQVCLTDAGNDIDTSEMIVRLGTQDG